MENQRGAKHLADVAGTFSGAEWAPADHPKPEPQRVYPLWERAVMDEDTERWLIAKWRGYGDLD